MPLAWAENLGQDVIEAAASQHNTKPQNSLRLNFSIRLAAEPKCEWLLLRLPVLLLVAAWGKYQRKLRSLQLLLPNPWCCLLGAERCCAPTAVESPELVIKWYQMLSFDFQQIPNCSILLESARFSMTYSRHLKTFQSFNVFDPT